MILIENLKNSFYSFLKKTFELNDTQVNLIEFTLNIDEAKKDFGDINSNAALILAKQLKKNPREIATTIASFKNTNVEKIEIAGAGFINLFLTKEAYIQILKELFTLKENFFKLDPNVTKSTTYSVEFVSANPTGPLHFGHGRGGIVGDVLGNVLKFLNYNVTKEFYINDAGNQIKKLGESLKVRCQQQMGQNVEIPEEGYQGEYLIELAKKAIEENSDILSQSDEFFENYARNYCLKEIQKTLAEYGIHYDVWFSEKSLHDSGQIKTAIDKLTSLGYTYTKDDALWFKSTDFGDDKDRVVIKSSGELTYVAADIAYMLNKVQRGANDLVMVLGQDHHSYAVRLEGIRQALQLKDIKLDIILYQLVKMKEGDQLLRMSKRAGRIVTLKDIVETVGKDVARFFYLNRKVDAQLEFDLDLALKKTEENPVFYVQYAYVRTRAIIEKAQLEKELQNIDVNDISNIGTEEYFLIKKIVALKSLLETISKNHQTHLLAYYLIELATIFHRYYYNNRIIEMQNIEKSKARLLMTMVLKDTFETCLKLLGISQPEKM